MYYDLAAFGGYICKKRKKMLYTQRGLAELTFISRDTLRRIESGKVLSSQLTLEALSTVLKEDLNLTLLDFRLDNRDSYLELKKE